MSRDRLVLVLACATGSAACVRRTPVAEGTHDGGGEATAADPACTRALAPFVSRDFASLEGLPPHCTPEDVAAVLQQVSTPGRGWLGDPERELELRVYQVPGWEEVVHGWYEDGVLVLLDTDRPQPRRGWKALIRELGDPQARLDFAWHIHTLREAEWIYPVRGLAIVVKPDPGLILRIASFAPTTAEIYARELRFISDYREKE